MTRSAPTSAEISLPRAPRRAVRLPATVPLRGLVALGLLGTAAVLSVACLLASASPAMAGGAALGQPLFYPCTSCHPLTTDASGTPTKRLPGGFTRHQIELDAHDKLGKGRAACGVCHDDAARNPGKLKLADGSLIDITGDTARVCYRCHSDKYDDFKAGAHGKHKRTCTAAGCHDPHTPRWIYAEPLLPFLGSGMQFKAVAEREPFTPLAAPAPQPRVQAPGWFTILAVVGLVAAGGQASLLLLGRLKR